MTVVMTRKTPSVLQAKRDPWPYHAVTTPIFAAVLVSLIGRIIDMADWPLPFVAMGCVALLLICPAVAVVMDWGGAAVFYGLVTGMVSGSWIMWAAWTSAYSLTSLGFLLIALLVVGPFYGPVRYYVRKAIVVHEARTKAAQEGRDPDGPEAPHVWEAIMRDAGYSRMRHIRTDEQRAGFSVHMQLPRKGSMSVKTLQGTSQLANIEVNAAEHLNDQYKIRRGAIRVEGGEMANDVIIHVSTRDILAEKIDLPDHSGPETIHNPFELGLFEDGSPIMLLFLYIQATIVGMTDAGKSNLINLLIYAFTRCTDTLVWVAAPDKGIPLVTPWMKPFVERRTGASVLDWVAIDVPECARVILGLYKAADIRSRSARGGADKVNPSPQQPSIIGILEEATGLLDSNEKFKTHKGEMRTASWIVKEIARLGRSEAVTLIIITQRGTVSMYGAHGGDMKANIGLRMGMRTAQSGDNKYVFPDDPELALHLLKHNGSLYLKRLGVDNRPMPGKVYYLEPVHRIPMIAEKHSAYLSSMEIETEREMGTLYTQRWSDERAGELMDQLCGIAPPPKQEPTQAAASVAVATTTIIPIVVPDAYKEAAAKKRAEDRIDAHAAAEVAALEAMLAELSSPEPEPDEPLESAPSDEADPRRGRMLDLIAEAGEEGTTPKDLLAALTEEGNPPKRQTLQRWLNEEVAKATIRKSGYGRYAIPEGDEE